MSFTTSVFLIGFLPWLFLLIFLLRKTNGSKSFLIFIANIIFYIWNGVGFLIFICLFSIVIWIFTLIVAKNKSKVVFSIIVSMSVLPLVLCKYSEFAISAINTLVDFDTGVQNFIVPLGISFFTFEAISLLTDIYKHKISDSISFSKVFLYITFFPTVTSGPIVRYDNFAEGLSAHVNGADFAYAIERIVFGLCKKVLIADKIALLADFYFDGVSSGRVLSAMGLWIGSIAYSLQLYYDFSGYSDMAIGMGRLMGFNIPENFNKPYQAKSISDFWKRWHISLSLWFRDYVYIPLGGNRCTAQRHIFNMFAVWILTGLWHGAEGSFVVWGLGYFILLISEKYVPFMKKIGSSWFGSIYTLFFVNLLWVPFRAQNLIAARNYVFGMFGRGSSGCVESIAVDFIPFLLFAMMLCFPVNRIFSKYQEKRWFNIIRGVSVIVLAAISVCAVINSSYSPYIYGNF